MTNVRELKRSDLQKNKSNLPIDKITIWNFRASSIS